MVMWTDNLLRSIYTADASQARYLLAVRAPLVNGSPVGGPSYYPSLLRLSCAFSQPETIDTETPQPVDPS